MLLGWMWQIVRESYSLEEGNALYHYYTCKAGKKMTAGIATTTVPESLPVWANTALWRDFGVRHIALYMLPLNFAPGSYGPGPFLSLGKERALTSPRQLW